MKIIFLAALMLFIISYTVHGQSTMEFQTGTNIEVMNGADICADNFIINGTFSGGGTMCAESGISANLKVFLQGCYIGGSMSSILNLSGYIPLSQPYNNPPWNYSGTESVGSIPDGVVDWILVELRTNETTVLSRRAGFLKSSGTITDVNGSSQLNFPGVSSGDYYIVLIHRNHLAIMSHDVVALDAVCTLYDFTTSQSKAYGTNPMFDMYGTFGMYSADANGNGQIQNNDTENFWKVQNGQSGYKSGDFNLNGQVQNNDHENYFKLNNGKGTQVTFSN